MEELDKKLKNAVKEAKQDGHGDETTLLRAVFNHMGGEPTSAKPEVSALNLNESEFGMAEDSQMNDVIEFSNFAKPSMVGRFLDYNNPDENKLAERFRKKNVQDQQRDSQKHRGSQIEVVEQNLESSSRNELFEEPQNFPDLDTSGIDIEATHHIDKDFGDGDGSFIGFRDHNSFEAADNNDIFDPKPSPFCPNENQIPITPQVSLKVSHKINLGIYN